MGFGASIFLVAVGAILALAVDLPAQGVNVNAIGVILMLLGVALFVLTLLFWGDQMPWRRDRTVVRERSVEDPAVPPADRPPRGRRRRRVVERERPGPP